MQNFLRITLVLATVASIGDVILRRLPEKILADLNAPRTRTVAHSNVAVTATRPTPVFAFANTALSPEQIALAGRVVSFSTQNLRFAASSSLRSSSN